jgi:hypothetical protein
MKVPTRSILLTLALALALGLGGYVVFRYSTIAVKESSSISQQSSEMPLEAASSTERQGFPSKPPAPPKPVGEPIKQSSPEAKRVLVGTTAGQLEHIERQLPAGSTIATYAISETEQRAAFALSDLFGDGNTETFVVYKAQGTEPVGGGQPLFLGVLTPTGNTLALGSTAPLYGGLIYISLYDRHAVPFAIRDVTGDGHPEIIVTSGVGASLGGAIQIYSFDGSSLRQIAMAHGHILDLYDKGPGKPSEIVAQSRYENRPRIYRWNGNAFEP